MSGPYRGGRKPIPIPNDLAELIANGLSRADVAQRYGVSIFTVRNWLRKCGVKMKRGRRFGSFGQRRCDHSAIQAYRAAGMTLRAVGEKYGISFQRVHQIVTNSSAKPAPKPPQSRSVPPQPERRLRGRELDTAIVAEWNKAKLTMREIGALYGVTRNSVARCLFNARARGEYVLAIDPATYAKRQSAGYGLVERAARMRAAKAAKRAAAQSPAGIDSVSSAVLTPAAWPAWNGEFVTIEDLMTVAKL